MLGRLLDGHWSPSVELRHAHVMLLLGHWKPLVQALQVAALGEGPKVPGELRAEEGMRQRRAFAYKTTISSQME